MVSVNGNYDNRANYFLAKEVVKKEIAEEKVEKAVVEQAKQEFKERGEELLNGAYNVPTNMFVIADRIDKETADELSEMFAMAGISHRLPTRTEYARIAGATQVVLGKLEPFATEQRIQELFKNAPMDLLAEETDF